MFKIYYKTSNYSIDKREQFLIDGKLNKTEKSKIVDKSVQYAYGDVKRTIRGISNYRDREEIKMAANRLLTNALQFFMKSEINYYDEWHCELTFQLIKVFSFNTFTVGQAQKWINMSFKYLYCFSYIHDLSISENRFSECHIPIDNYVMYNAEKQYGIKKLPVPWSKLNDYGTYVEYQNEIRKIADRKQFMPIDLDFELWKKP